jgi:hypothetical protein
MPTGPSDVDGSPHSGLVLRLCTQSNRPSSTFLTHSTMRGFALLPLLAATAVQAVPANDVQTILSELGAGYNDLASVIAGKVAEGVAQVLKGVEEKSDSWLHEGEFIKQSGLTCEDSHKTVICVMTHPTY